MKDQIAILDQAFLSPVVSRFPDPYLDDDKARIHAYLVLSHAVLEESLECILEAHYRRLAAALSADNVPIDCVMLAFSFRDMLAKVDSYAKRDTVQLLAHQGLAEFQVKLRSNNGIKPANVESLLRFVGTHWDAFESALSSELADLNTLGVKRGAAGHLSPFTAGATSITTNDGPEDVRAWVQSALAGLESIDHYLRNRVT